MNRDCNGDTFTRWGDQWGRCFGDGGLFKIVALLDGRCPRCSRKWEPADFNPSIFDPSTDADVAKVIDVPILLNHHRALVESCNALRTATKARDVDRMVIEAAVVDQLTTGELRLSYPDSDK